MTNPSTAHGTHPHPAAFGFTDADGTIPAEQRRARKRVELEAATPVQWSLAAELPKPTAPAMDQFFKKAFGSKL